MAVEKTITFVEKSELNQDYGSPEVKMIVYYWTEIDGTIVDGSCNKNEEKAKAFYEKICELKGETSNKSVLHTTTIHSKTNKHSKITIKDRIQ
tara:strand:- start:955 stop:1233 length:279 start_codon:yes stop_codon:yes gene_type:complete